jgi:hypothetical protein
MAVRWRLRVVPRRGSYKKTVMVAWVLREVRGEKGGLVGVAAVRHA